MPPPLVPLTVSRVGRRFGGSLAISDLSFEISAGEIVGLLGPNGAGKSTTLRILAGLLAPSTGTVVINGHDLSRSPGPARAQTGYAPETPPSDPDLTVRGLLSYAARLHGLPSDAVTEALRLADLDSVRDARIETLSRGLRRRLGVARALVHDPSVLLLDEPAAGLDPDRRVAMRGLLRTVADRGTALLLSTHLLDDAEALCDRVLILRDGRLVGSARPPTERTLLLHTAAPPADADARLGAVQGVRAVVNLAPGRWRLTTATDVRADVARASVDWGLLELRTLGDLEAEYLATRPEGP